MNPGLVALARTLSPEFEAIAGAGGARAFSALPVRAKAEALTSARSQREDETARPEDVSQRVQDMEARLNNLERGIAAGARGRPPARTSAPKPGSED